MSAGLLGCFRPPPPGYWDTAFQAFKRHRDYCRTCCVSKFWGPYCAEGLQLRNNWIDEEGRNTDARSQADTTAVKGGE